MCVFAALRRVGNISRHRNRIHRQCIFTSIPISYRAYVAGKGVKTYFGNTVRGLIIPERCTRTYSEGENPEQSASTFYIRSVVSMETRDEPLPHQP